MNCVSSEYCDHSKHVSSITNKDGSTIVNYQSFEQLDLLYRMMKDYSELQIKAIPFESEFEAKKCLALSKRIKTFLKKREGKGTVTQTYSPREHDLLWSVLSRHQNCYSPNPPPTPYQHKDGWTAYTHHEMDGNWYPNNMSDTQCPFTNDEMRELRAMTESVGTPMFCMIR